MDSSLLSWVAGVLVIFVGFQGFGNYCLSYSRFKLDFWGKLSIGTITGMVLFVILVMIGNSLGARSMVLPLVLLVGIFWTLSQLSGFSWTKPNISRLTLAILTLVVLGTAAHLYRIAPSGMFSDQGVSYYSVNARDGLWHTTLMRSLITDLPPVNLAYSAVPLSNYHYLVDLIGAEIHIVTGLSLHDIYFRFLPAFHSLFLGLATFSLMRLFTRRAVPILVAVFLMYFGGSFGYIPTLLGYKISTWEAAFWSLQSVTFPLNPPLMSSFLILLATIYLLKKLNKSISWSQLIILSSLTGILISIKAYASVLILIAISIAAIYQLISDKRWVYSSVFIGSLAVSLLLYLPHSSGGTDFFAFEPGVYIRTMMESPEKLNNVDWELRRQTYVSESNSIRVAQLWITGAIIFIIGNLGSRIFGTIYSIKVFSKNRLNQIEVIMLVIFFAGVTIPLFFVQRGNVWDAVQFIYFSLFVGNILTALFLDWLYKNHFKSIIVNILAFSIIVLALPSTIQTLYHQKIDYDNQPAFTITNDELDALKFFENTPTDGLVIAPLSQFSYISTFTGKPVYIENEFQANTLRYDFEDKLQFIDDFFCNNPTESHINLLRYNSDISHIYLPTANRCAIKFTNAVGSELNSIFENEAATIFRLN